MTLSPAGMPRTPATEICQAVLDRVGNRAEAQVTTQQGRPALSGQHDVAQSLPAVRPSGRLGLVEELLPLPDPPDASRLPQVLAPLLTLALDSEPHGGTIVRPGPNADTYRVVPTCERLPYDANAPPPVA